jgi:hypothetical protein
MTLTVKNGSGGSFSVRKSGRSGGLRYEVFAEEGGRICHVRAGDGCYLATVEYDGTIRRNMIFNVYKGENRCGTIAAAPRFEMEDSPLPVLSFSWDGLQFDGRLLTELFPGTERRRRRRIAEFTRGFGGNWRIRMPDASEEDSVTDAVLAMTAALAWERLRTARR